MSLATIPYSTDPDVFDIDGVEAGSASEMETKLQALIDSAADPAGIGDLVLAGVEEGPGWVATLVFGVGGSTVNRTPTAAVAAVAGNKDEAREKLLARLIEVNTEVSPEAVFSIGKIEVAGGGDGSNFMALALARISTS